MPVVREQDEEDSDFLENVDEYAVTVTKERYIDVLNKFYKILGTRSGVFQDVQRFQQNGAIPHSADIMMEWLDNRLSNRLMSRCCPHELSPHSPDLTPRFYL